MGLNLLCLPNYLLKNLRLIASGLYWKNLVCVWALPNLLLVPKTAEKALCCATAPRGRHTCPGGRKGRKLTVPVFLPVPLLYYWTPAQWKENRQLSVCSDYCEKGKTLGDTYLLGIYCVCVFEKKKKKTHLVTPTPLPGTLYGVLCLWSKQLKTSVLLCVCMETWHCWGQKEGGLNSLMC